MNNFFGILSMVIVVTGALLTIPIMIKMKYPFASPLTWAIKSFPEAFAHYLAAASLVACLLALGNGMWWTSIVAVYAYLFYMGYLYGVKDAILSAQHGLAASAPTSELFLKSPVAWRLPVVSPDAYQVQHDIPFHTIPGLGRTLLCDVWEPAAGAYRSGLAMIYFHGSAWCVLDKDFGTRKLFSHLTAQGHVIMDVAYRLYPETNMMGMVQDVYRSIAWMKEHAREYAIDPGKIVLGGGSAGGHLSMLAAYHYEGYRRGMEKESWVPAEIIGHELSVNAVISMYGPTDLVALYDRGRQDLLDDKLQRSYRKNKKEKSTPSWMLKMLGNDFHRSGFDRMKAPALLPEILGCRPEECPALYAAYSPVSHVTVGSPATLQIQGTHDIITPPSAAEKLHRLLREKGVYSELYLLPLTDHAFDLVVPRISMVAHSAYYVVERFLARRAVAGTVEVQVTGKKELVMG